MPNACQTFLRPLDLSFHTSSLSLSLSLSFEHSTHLRRISPFLGLKSRRAMTSFAASMRACASTLISRLSLSLSRLSLSLSSARPSVSSRRFFFFSLLSSLFFFSFQFQKKREKKRALGEKENFIELAATHGVRERSPGDRRREERS